MSLVSLSVFVIKGVPLGHKEVLGSSLLGFVTSGLLNLQRRLFLIFQGFCFRFRLEELKLTPSSSPIFLAYRMARGHKEVLTSQTGCRRGTPREMPTARNVVVVMSIEELRLYSLVPAEISLEVLDGTTTSTVGEADNAIYFTREQFVVGLRFLIPSLVKHFIHFTQAPSALVHLNVFGF